MQIQILCQEDLAEKGMETHSSILAWRITWITVHRVAKSQTHLKRLNRHTCT